MKMIKNFLLMMTVLLGMTAHAQSRSNSTAANDSLQTSLINKDAPYALLYIYRPSSFFAAAIGYKVSIDDSTSVTMRNGRGFIVKLYKEGRYRLSAKTEKKKEFALDVKHGEVYFVKCSMNMGYVVGVPHFELIADAPKAYDQFLKTDTDQAIVKKEKGEDDTYK